MEMSIARLSTSMAAMNIGTEISMKVMKMAMEQMEDVGELMEGLIDSSVGQLLDVSV